MNKEEFLKLFNECLKDGDIRFDTEKYGESVILYLELRIGNTMEKHQITYFGNPG